jgi:hypothetical protein
VPTVSSLHGKFLAVLAKALDAQDLALQSRHAFAAYALNARLMRGAVALRHQDRQRLPHNLGL